MTRTEVLLGLAIGLLSACGGAPPAPKTSEAPAAVASAPGETDGTAENGVEAVAEGSGTVIKFQVPPVGAVRTDSQSFDLAMDMTVKGKGKPQTQHTVEQRKSVVRSTVLAIQGKAITKKKVTYEKDERVQIVGARTQSMPSPLTGKTYVLSLKGGKLHIEREDGEAVSEMEDKAIRVRNQSFGKPSRFAAFVPEKNLESGQTFEPNAEALSEMFGGGDKRFGSVKFRFEGREGDLARFSFTLVITEKSGVTMKSKGHVLLRVDTGWPTEMALDADVSLSTPGKAPGESVSGTGTAHMEVSASYEG